MQIIPINAIANQAFSINLDSNQWDFLIKSTNGTISVSLTLNGNDLLDSARAVGNGLIIPSQYQEAGNFMIFVQNFDLPDYRQFGITQSLIYLSASDLAAIRVPPSDPITGTFFNPDAALPLRFKPQGYDAIPPPPLPTGWGEGGWGDGTWGGY